MTRFFDPFKTGVEYLPICSCAFDKEMKALLFTLPLLSAAALVIFNEWVR